MSSTLKQSDVSALPEVRVKPSVLAGYLPLVVGIAGGLALIGARLQIGETALLHNGSTVMLALILFICSGVLHLTHLYVREQWIRVAGIWLASVGLAFDIGSWGIRWIEAGALENWSEWVWRYIPLANLYDITVAFVFVAVIFTLWIVRKERNSAVAAMTMPVASLLLMLAVFLGNEHRTLQPILDSYWRPIHVGIAATGYGVCLVSFGLAILYLLKDGVRMSSAAAWVAGFGAFVYISLDRFSVLAGSYSSSVLIGSDPLSLFGGGSLRVPVPGAGLALLVAFLTILAAAIVLSWAALAEREDLRRLGMKVMTVSIAVQLVAVSFVIWRVTSLDDVAGRAIRTVAPDRLLLFGAKLAENSQIDPSTLSEMQLANAARQTLEANAEALHTGVRSNPIELAALITVLVAMAVIAFLAFRPERVVESLPSLKALDRLQYLSVSIAFPLLTLLLITGAVWANESWGRYWGWDNKEVGALVTWLAYAGYLHTRIAHGWDGRRSAYVAVVGFLFVIFTYLGVSYLLPGLHSYAS